MQLSKSAQVKQMSTTDRNKLFGLLFSDWEKNDETLFRYSPWYRMAFSRFFAFMSYNPKYFKVTVEAVTHYKPINGHVRMLKVVNDN